MANVKLFTYTLDRVPVKGKAVVNTVKYQGQRKLDLPVPVVRGNRSNLLGRSWLKCFRLNWEEIFSLNSNIDTWRTKELRTVLEKHRDV